MNETKPVLIKRGEGTFAKRCKHFAGINFTEPAKQCKAGCVMMNVFVTHDPPLLYIDHPRQSNPYKSTHSFPCFVAGDSSNLGGATCDKAEFPTAEEIEAHRKEITESFERVATAIQAIQAETKGARGVAGKIPCPVCKTGTLGYSVAAINGHIWGKCSTENCVAWMQ